MATMKESADHYESVDGPRPAKGGKVKRHCTRFWWIYVILFIVIALVVVLPVIFVGYPNIARSGIAEARTNLLAQVYSNPAPDAVDVRLDAELISTSAFKPRLYPFDANFFLDGRNAPFTTVQFPEIDEAANGTRFTIAQRVPIANYQEVVQFSRTLLSSPEFVVKVRGRGQLKQGALQTITVDYDQTINLKGLNGLQGIEVSNFRLGQDLPFGANGNGTAMIPNPSVATLALGDVLLNMFVDGAPVGTTTIPSLTLTPGNNSYPLYVNVNQTIILGLLQDPRYRCGVLPLDLRGNTSSVNGQTIPYYTDALRSNTQRVVLNLTETFQAAGLGNVINSTNVCET